MGKTIKIIFRRITMDMPELVLLVLLVLLVCLLGLAILFIHISWLGLYELYDRYSGQYKWIDATIIEKSYTPQQTHTGVGPSMGSSGGIAVTVGSTPEKHMVFLKDKDADRWKMNVDEDFYFDCNKKDKVKLEFTVGRSGKYYGPLAIRKGD